MCFFEKWWSSFLFPFKGKNLFRPFLFIFFFWFFFFQAKQRARPPAFAFCKLIQSQLFIVFWRYIYILMIIQNQVLEEAEMLKCGSCRLHSGFCLPFCAQLHGFSPFWFELGCAFFHQKREAWEMGLLQQRSRDFQKRHFSSFLTMVTASGRTVFTKQSQAISKNLQLSFFLSSCVSQNVIFLKFKC